MGANREWTGFYRFWLFLMWSLPIPFWCILIVKSFPESMLVLIVQVVWTLLLYPGLRQYPRIVLLEEGVQARVLFRKKIYAWKDIIQAGIVWRLGRSGYYNDFVLVKQGGSRRRYKDKTFLMRNSGKLIHINTSKDVRDFVIRHYGPLDFDLTNGQEDPLRLSGGY